MKKARMNISHSRFSLFKLKIFGEIVTTIDLFQNRKENNHAAVIRTNILKQMNSLHAKWHYLRKCVD